MTSRKDLARLAGGLYCVWGLMAGLSTVAFPSTFIVANDARATASRIVSSPLLYRLAVFGDLMAFTAAVLMAVTLYELFKDVHRGYARLMVALVVVQVPMAFAIMLLQIAPLSLLGGAGFWSAFHKPQLEALALGALGLRGQGIAAMSMYWGLWLLPLGTLVYRSRFMPRVIGVFLLAAGIGYVAATTTHFLFPGQYRLIFNAVATPAAALGEGSFVAWLLIKGIRAEP